jgi:hypothetical protein
MAADAVRNTEKERAESNRCWRYMAIVTSSAGRGHSGGVRSAHHRKNVFQA